MFIFFLFISSLDNNNTTFYITNSFFYMRYFAWTLVCLICHCLTYLMKMACLPKIVLYLQCIINTLYYECTMYYLTIYRPSYSVTLLVNYLVFVITIAAIMFYHNKQKIFLDNYLRNVNYHFQRCSCYY